MPPAATAAVASMRRSMAGTVGSSPTPSTPTTPRNPCATPPANATAGCCAKPTWPTGAPLTTNPPPRNTAATPSPNAASGRKGPCICNSWRCCGIWALTAWTPHRRNSCTASLKSPNSPSPTEQPGMATLISCRCRLSRCSATRMRSNAPPASAQGRPRHCNRAAPPASRPASPTWPPPIARWLPPTSASA
ncbi:hypothetical protein G6F31_017246 [Rhizopus arrhizus]|nr:hypothetical protein G6F31_017246 [Rhizopus arrhizus]